MMIPVALALLTLSMSGETDPGSSLEKFSPAGQAQISKAASTFVVGEDGTFWDCQIEARKADKARRSDAESDALSDECHCAPLWFNAAGGRFLTTADEIAGVSIKVADQPGCSSTTDRYVCKNILSGGRFIVERWKDNSQAEKRWLDRYAPKTPRHPLDKTPAPTHRPPPPPPWEETPDLVIMTGHKFDKVGDRVDRPVVKEKGSEVVNGETYRLIEECPPPERTTIVSPVTPDKLAEGILDGRVRLTEWRFSRTDPDTLSWRSTDVTPVPTVAKIGPAPKPTKTSGPAPKTTKKHSAGNH